MINIMAVMGMGTTVSIMANTIRLIRIWVFNDKGVILRNDETV